MLNPVYISCTNLNDTWFQCLYQLISNGRIFKIDKGSYEGQRRLELDYITIHIKYPNIEPIIPSIPAQYNIPDPVTMEYVNNYLSYLIEDIKQENEQYTYGEFLKPQINEVIRKYKNEGHRTNQCYMTVGNEKMIYLTDPPCLRGIDTRIQDNKLHFFVYFRSWDAFNGLPANLAAIQLLKEYMCNEIGVEDGQIIAASKGLHLYDYVWEIAELRTGITIKGK